MSLSEIKTDERLEIKDAHPAEIIAMGIETERLESIPVNSLILDESIIDEPHRDELAESMSGDRGQLIPIGVRARLNHEGNIVYDIFDGFHRGAALLLKQERNGTVFVEAKVVYGCSDEELYDLRITAVNSVRSISFPRMITWMQRSFEQTEWYQKGLTLSQVMAIAMTDPERSYSGLDRQGVEEVKKWATAKAKKWNKSISAIYQDTRSVENADPELVKRVRIGAGGRHDKKGILNPARFRAMVDELPGQYDLQRIMANIIFEHNLDQHLTRAVAREVAKCRDNPEALELIKMDPLATIGEFSAGIETEEIEVPLQPKKIPHRYQRYGKKYLSTSISLDGYLIQDDSILSNALQMEITQANAHKFVEQQQAGNPLWFEIIPNLTGKELNVAELFFKQGKDIDEISFELNMLPKKTYAFLQSVTRKYVLLQEDMKLGAMIESVKKNADEREK